MKVTEKSMANELQEQLLSNRATETKLDTILADIVIKSNLVDSKFDEPDLWATVGNICDTMENKADVSLLEIVKLKLELSQDHISQSKQEANKRLQGMNHAMMMESKKINTHKATYNHIFNFIKRDPTSLGSRVSREESS